MLPTIFKLLFNTGPVRTPISETSKSNTTPVLHTQVCNLAAARQGLDSNTKAFVTFTAHVAQIFIYQGGGILLAAAAALLLLRHWHCHTSQHSVVAVSQSMVLAHLHALRLGSKQL